MTRGRPGAACARPARPGGARSVGPAGDRGSATAELAVGLPVLVLLLLAAVTAVSAATTSLRCVDAARESARAAARGEADPAGFGRRAAPDDARIEVTVDGDVVRVRVTAPVRPLGALVLPDVSGTAVAAREPDAGDLP